MSLQKCVRDLSSGKLTHGHSQHVLAAQIRDLAGPGNVGELIGLLLTGKVTDSRAQECIAETIKRHAETGHANALENARPKLDGILKPPAMEQISRALSRVGGTAAPSQQLRNGRNAGAQAQARAPQQSNGARMRL